jgi:hypothetical protein
MGGDFKAHAAMIAGMWLKVWACNPWLAYDEIRLR